MSGDKLKAAFLGLTDRGKASLAKSCDERAQRELRDVADVRQQLVQMDDAHPDKAKWAHEASTLEGKVQAARALEPVRDAYVALGSLGNETKDLRERVTEAGSALGQGRKQLGLLDLNLIAIRRTALMTPNAKAAEKTRTALAKLEIERAQVGKDEEKAEALLGRAVKALKEAEKGLLTKPETGSERAASRGVLDTMAGVPGLDGILSPSRADGRGRRNAGEEAAARLDVFDGHFANPAATEAAQVENTAMRTGAVIRAAAMQQARTRNDPSIAHRLGALMVDEYAPDLKLDAKTKALTEALVMDDPVQKLLTGKIRFEDAVQRIRDQAQIGDVDPSRMLKLLRNQFEMHMGSLDLNTDITNARLEADVVLKTDVNGNVEEQSQKFVLSDLEGEIDPSWAKRPDTFGLAGPALDAGGLKLGPAFKATLDKLEQELTAWDTEETAGPDVLGIKAPSWAGQNKPPQLDQPGTGRETDPAPSGLTEKALADAAARLTDPAARTTVTAIKTTKTGTDREREVDKDGNYVLVEKPLQAAPYIAAPGLGQDHKVRAPLANGDDRAALHGALDEREYAHLRMLQRADAEDRATAISVNGKKQTPEQVVRTFLGKTYALDDNGVDRLLKAVAVAFDTVPLTITFAAESMFSEDKDAPAHGTAYVSDVVYTRSQEDASGLIGRGDNVGIDPAPVVAPEKPGTIAPGVEEMIEQRKRQGADTAELEALLKKAQESAGETAKGANGGPTGPTSPKVGIVGGAGGSWKEERGENYQRWRPDKDRREGRLDERMLQQNAQTFGAVNPSFDKTQGTSAEFMGTDEGRNYYGNAHFLLNDGVRGRAAFSVRGASISVGGGKTAVQRTDLVMMLFDMIRGSDSNLRYIDAIALLAKGGAKALATATDWEIHIYGGFDMTKDAKSIYLSSKIQDPVRTRIEKFAAKNNISVETSIPDGKAVIAKGDPVRQELASI